MCIIVFSVHMDKKESIKKEPKKESEQNPDYYHLVFTEDQINNVTHHVVCDPKAYKQASLNKIKEFSRFAFHKLFYFHELE